jgi:hypothetical protein
MLIVIGIIISMILFNTGLIISLSRLQTRCEALESSSNRIN